MNSRQKAVEAIQRYEALKAAQKKAAEDASLLVQQVALANREAARVLHAVFGDKASCGIVYAGTFYRITPAADGWELESEPVTWEALE